MTVIVVGLGLPAIIARRPELRGELLIIMAGLLIPLAILQTIFSGLNDWEWDSQTLMQSLFPTCCDMVELRVLDNLNAICYCVDWYSIGVDTTKIRP